MQVETVVPWFRNSGPRLETIMGLLLLPIAFGMVAFSLMVIKG